MSAEMHPRSHSENQIQIENLTRLQRIGMAIGEKLTSLGLLHEASDPGVLRADQAQDVERSITGEMPIINPTLDHNQIARGKSLVRNNPSVYGPGGHQR